MWYLLHYTSDFPINGPHFRQSLLARSQFYEVSQFPEIHGNHNLCLTSVGQHDRNDDGSVEVFVAALTVNPDLRKPLAYLGPLLAVLLKET